MGTALVVTLVVLGGAALFALAWWSSGRTKKAPPRRHGPGEIGQSEAYFEADVHRTGQRDAGGFGSPF